MMSFFLRKNKGVDYKARLEHKLYLAREDPDLTFDLSDCDLKNVPKGVYSICKVLRKEALILKSNHLTSLSGGGNLFDLCLLNVLDISSNNLTSLPDNIHFLENLKELYLNNNLIKYLPENIVKLGKLRLLSAPFNCLKRLPANMSELGCLEELILQGNPALCVLPDCLVLCRRLRRLALDVGRYTHPPDDVVQGGTSAVLSYLGQRIGVDYKGPQAAPAESPQDEASCLENNSSSSYHQQLQEKIAEFERKKDLKQKDFLALEKNLAEQKDKELAVQNELKKGKNRLVEDLKKQQMKIAEEVLKFQNKKEAERDKLIEHIKEAEEEADRVINHMLDLNRSTREPWSVLQLQELDRSSEQLLFQQQLEGDLKKKEILHDMANLLENERSNFFQYEELRAQTIRDSLSREADWDRKLSELLERRGRPLSCDRSEQEAAVAMLLERSDLESGRLRAQLRIIEAQLAHLTAAEMKKAKMDLSQITNELCEKRAQLSALLVSTLEERDARKAQLLRRLRRMEEAAAETDQSPDYWLVQYQKLLESQSVLDPDLVRAFLLAGLHRHLPLLLSLDLHCLTLEQIKQEVASEEEAWAVLKTVQSYLSTQLSPSAPPQEALPSAPPAADEGDYQSECVVCMAQKCQIVYVPCGHLCCCQSCSTQLTLCPLCRREIDSKVFLVLS